MRQAAAWWIDQVRSTGGIATEHKTDAPVRFWLEVSW
jgi:hypothetical protein